MLHKSVTDPPESVTETIGSGVVANTNYSLVVVAGTEVWNTSTAPYNFSESCGMPNNKYLLNPSMEEYSLVVQTIIQTSGTTS